MFEPTTKEKADVLLNVPMVEWSDMQHGLHQETKREIVEYLDVLIEASVRLRAYLECRTIRDIAPAYDDKNSHSAAVRAQNKLGNKVRKILGYSYPSEVSF